MIITKLYPNFKHVSFGYTDRKRKVSFIAVKHNKHVTKMETFDTKLTFFPCNRPLTMFFLASLLYLEKKSVVKFAL